MTDLRHLWEKYYQKELINKKSYQIANKKTNKKIKQIMSAKNKVNKVVFVG